MVAKGLVHGWNGKRALIASLLRIELLLSIRCVDSGSDLLFSVARDSAVLSLTPSFWAISAISFSEGEGQEGSLSSRNSSVNDSLYPPKISSDPSPVNGKNCLVSQKTNNGY